MKCIIVQVHTSHDTTYSLKECLEVIRGANRYPEVEPHQDNNNIVDLNFFTDDPAAFWEGFQKNILSHAVCGQWLNKVAIIVYEGEQGWEDALLLAHFDNTEKTDQL